MTSEIPVRRVLVWSVLLASPVFCQKSEQRLDVCEVLQDLSALSGKLVTIRGVWRLGDTGQDLEPSAPCKHATVRDGWKWSDSIDVEPVGWDNRPDSVVAQYFALRRAHPEGIKIFATVSGRLETRDHFRVRKYPRGRDLPVAFGYAVARLLLVDAKDLEAIAYEPGEQKEELKRDRSPYPVRVSKE